jgi:hypothetical protein
MIDVTFELAAVVGCFYDYAFRLLPVQAPAPRPIPRSEDMIRAALRAFNDSGTFATVHA